MQATAWTYNVAEPNGTYTASLSFHRPEGARKVHKEPLYTRQEIAKVTDGLLAVAKAFMAAYDQNEEDEWNREWQELAEMCRAAIAMAETPTYKVSGATAALLPATPLHRRVGQRGSYGNVR